MPTAKSWILTLPAVLCFLMGCSGTPESPVGQVGAPALQALPIPGQPPPGKEPAGEVTEGVRCFICGHGCETMDELATHMERAHKRCPICGIWCTDEAELEIHHEFAHRGMTAGIKIWVAAYVLVVTAVYTLGGFLVGG